MNKVIACHAFKSIPGMIMLSTFETMSGTQMFAVTTFKPDGERVLRNMYIAANNGDMQAREHYDNEVKRDN